MALKLNISEFKVEENQLFGIMSFRNDTYKFTIKREEDKKQINLPFSLARLIPLQNFTRIPRSVFRLIVKCNSTDSAISDNLFVDHKSHLEKRDHNQGNWLFATDEIIEIFSNDIFDFFSKNSYDNLNLEIRSK